MVKMNRFLMVSIIAIVLIALAGSAYALPIIGDNPLPGLTVTANTVQTNGNYIGIQTLINSKTYDIYGYNYTFVPDGSYTVTGTITNDLNTSQDVEILLINKSAFSGEIFNPIVSYVNVSAAGSNPGTASFSMTLPSGFVNSTSDIGGYYVVEIGGPGYILTVAIVRPIYSGIVDFSNANYINTPEWIHTVNEGPMSNMTLNYSNGAFNFGNSPLYAFAE
jgi:hypothetical protein